MKTIDVGSYYIIDENKNSIELENNSIIGFEGTTACIVCKDISLLQFDEAVLFRILDDSIEFVRCHSKKENCLCGIIPACDGQMIRLNNKDWLFTFVCNDEKIEDAIMSFMKNDLTGEYDIKKLYIQYAKKKKISEKKAMYHIITTIDVPEIDRI